MNKILNSILAATLLTGETLSAAETAQTIQSQPGTAATNSVAVKAGPAALVVEDTNSSPPGLVVANGTDERKDTDLGTNTLRLNFRGASLDQVLSYFSEAAGFVINVKPGTSVRGKVDVWSNEPLTKDEAINLLDTVLNQNGLAAIHNGKTLTIVNKDEAKTQNIPVVQGGDPDKIPITDKVVTQIIPVRFVEVAQLLKDLQPLVSSVNNTMTANEAGNAIVITDTQTVIHKVAEIIKAIDAGAEDFTELRVFRLVNADPNDTADLLSNLFPDDSRNGSNQSAFGGFRRLFGGGGFSSRGGFGGSTPSGSSSSGDPNSRIKKRNKLIAVADQRTASVVVSASHDLMDQIAEMIQELDGNPKGRATVKVYQFQNADPQAVLPILEEMFNKNGSQNSSRNNSSSQNSALMNRNSTQNNQSSSSSRGMTTGGTRGSSIGSFGQ